MFDYQFQLVLLEIQNTYTYIHTCIHIIYMREKNYRKRKGLALSIPGPNSDLERIRPFDSARPEVFNPPLSQPWYSFHLRIPHFSLSSNSVTLSDLQLCVRDTVHCIVRDYSENQTLGREYTGGWRQLFLSFFFLIFFPKLFDAFWKRCRRKLEALFGLWIPSFIHFWYWKVKMSFWL